MSNKALLIIDMQKGSFTPATPRFDADGVVTRINELSELFRKLGFPVIYIQHDGNGAGEFEKGDWDWENLDALNVEPTDLKVDKYANDSFYKSALADTLKSLKARQLYITGCATDFCVEATIQSAIAKDYDLTVVADAHTTADRPQLKAQQVIDHYNWVWQNMTPVGGRVLVKPLKEIKTGLLR